MRKKRLLVLFRWLLIIPLSLLGGFFFFHSNKMLMVSQIEPAGNAT